MAYGTNAPFGLRPIQSIVGNGSSGVLTAYKIASNTTAGVPATYDRSIFRGDIVYWNSHITSVVAPNPTYAGAGTIGTVADAAANTGPIGVFQGCEYFNSSNILVRAPYWPASTSIYPNTAITAFVNDDPMAIFEVQVSTSQNGVAIARLLQSMFGQNASVAIGAGTGLPVVNPTTGNAINGISGYYLDITTVAATITLPFKIIGYDTNALQNDNIFDATGNVRSFLTARVKFNVHYFGSTGTLGTTAA